MRSTLAVSCGAALVTALSALAITDGPGPYIPIGNGQEIPLSLLDVQPNSQIDFDDLSSFMRMWGTSSQAGDFNGDGVVDGLDLGILLAYFGASIDVAWPVVSQDEGDVFPPVDCLGCESNSEA